MKKVSKYICSIMTAVILVFNTSIIPAMNVHATSAVITYGISEILQSLLLSAGISYLGYQVTDKVSIDKRAIVQANSEEIQNAIAKAEALDADSSFADELSSAAEGTEFEYDGFKISVGANGYKVSAAKALVESAAKSIKTWADSDENTFLENSIKALEESAYSEISYQFSVDICTNSISDISTYYSSVITGKLSEMGVTDSNSMVVVSSTTFTETSFDAFSACMDDVSAPLHTGTVYVFYIIPFGYSYLGRGIYLNSNSDKRTRGQVYKSDALVDLPLKLGVMSYAGAEEYLHGIRSDDSQLVFYYPEYDDCEVRTIDFSAFDTTSYFPFSGYSAVFNYKNAVENGCMVVDYVKNGVIYVQKNEVSKKYITAGSGSIYANTDDYVSMDFDATTAETLASYEDLADYIAYATSLSEQLSDIKDAIEDSTEQNAAQAQEIVASINAQTNTLSDGISDVITTVKVQTDAIDDVLDATIAQTDAINDLITGVDDATLAITGPLEDILEAIQDLSITLPSDLTLSIPEEMMNITVQVPDVSTEVINQIEVTHDYPALQEAIAGAIAAPLEAAFVPDPNKVYALVDDFNHKFSFVDDMKTNVKNIEKYVFGVTPSPVLKIPIMKVNSKYDYGFGDYFIIDISWYEPFRPYGDLIILAFAWLFFIWRVFVSLPGIISGSLGNIWYDSSSIGTQPGIGMNDPTLIEDKRRGH